MLPTYYVVHDPNAPLFLVQRMPARGHDAWIIVRDPELAKTRLGTALYSCSPDPVFCILLPGQHLYQSWDLARSPDYLIVIALEAVRAVHKDCALLLGEKEMKKYGR